MVTSDKKEKAEALNFFTSVNCYLSSHNSQVDGQHDGVWDSKVHPTVNENQVHDHPRNLNVCKSMGSNEMHPRILWELAAVVGSPFSMILKQSWQSGQVPGGRKKGNIEPAHRKKV